MRVELFPPDSDTEPRHWVRHDQAFAMMLRPGSIEWGSKRSALEKFDYTAGDLALCDRHVGEWVGLMNVSHLQLGISDAALMACSDGAYGEVELRASRKFADPRLSAMVAAVHAEMVAGFPSGRLFLDSVEQAMAVTLVNGHAVRHRPVQIYRGGLGSARLRRIKELVHAKMEDDLSLDEMAQSVGLSTAHFARMFRKSTGETPHQFVLRQRLERAKAMLRAPDARVLDVAVACGFKTQQHFAQVFRDVWGVSPTEYRQDLSTPKRLTRRKAPPKIRHACDFWLQPELHSHGCRSLLVNVQPCPEFVTHRSLHPPQHCPPSTILTRPRRSSFELSSSFPQDKLQTQCKSLEFCLGEHEFSKIPTIPAEIRTSPFPICSLLTVVSRACRSIGRN